MHDQDIKGSIAYAKSLALSGILTKEEESKIITGLLYVGKEWKSSTVGFLLQHQVYATLTMGVVCRKG